MAYHPDQKASEKQRLKRQKRKNGIRRFEAQCRKDNRDFRGRMYSAIKGWIYPAPVLKDMVDAKKRKKEKIEKRKGERQKK